MKKRIIILLAAAVIIIAAVFFAQKDRDSKTDAAEAAVYTESPDYLETETDEVIRIKKLLISGYYRDAAAGPAEAVKKKSFPGIKPGSADTDLRPDADVKKDGHPETEIVKTVPDRIDKKQTAIKPSSPVKKKEIPEPAVDAEKKTEKAEPVKEIPDGSIPEVAVIQKTDAEEKTAEKDEEAEEKSDVWTDKPLFEIETPDDKGFYRKKVFVSGKILDTEIYQFRWKTEKGDPNEIETDYAGEFGFYIQSQDLEERLKIYISAVKDDKSRHDKVIVLFNRDVRPEIIIDKPVDNYKFGKYVSVEGRVNIPGHEGYISDLLKEALISLSPAGYEDNLIISKNGKFRYIADTSAIAVSEKQNLMINVSLNNYKSGSASVEISKSDYDFVDYKIEAGNSSIIFDWENIPVAAEYRINISSPSSGNKVISSIESPVKLGSLVNSNVYNVRIEAEETETGEILKGKNESVLPLDPASIKPDADGFFGRIKIKWPHVRGADKYNLFRKSVRSGKNAVLLRSFSGSSYTDENVTPAEKYSYSLEPDGLISVRSLETVTKPSTGAENKIHEIKEIEEADKIGNVFVINNYAYSLSENKIIISDISDLNNPVYAGEINEKADSLTVDEEYCYIISAESGFVLYNISNPGAPVQIVRREQYKGRHIWARFPYVYISEEEKGIRVLDLEQPDIPARKALYKGYSFSSSPVISLDEKSYMTAYDGKNNIVIFSAEPEGRLIKEHEVNIFSSVSKTQSTLVNKSIVTAVLSDNKKILIFNQETGVDEGNINKKHLIESQGISDFNFFTAHGGRSYLAVVKKGNTDLYSIDINGEPSFFTAVGKKNDENISFCHDNSGYAYIIKSENNIELYRVMTEGVSYVNNSFRFPAKVHDFEIADSRITALTEKGIYESDINILYPEAVQVSEGSYRQMWSSPLYTAAVNKKYDYEVFTPVSKTLFEAGRNGERVLHAEASGNYTVIFNKDREILVFSFDVSKNAPRLIAGIQRKDVEKIFVFSDAGKNYAGLILKGSVEILRITGENGLIRETEFDISKIGIPVSIKCEEAENHVNINLYSDEKIYRYIFSGGTVRKSISEENSGNISLIGDLIVESEGEEGISIYKKINGKKMLVSRCSGLFSFDTEYSDGKLYSRGFNSVDEIIPVIPVWFK